MKYKLINYHCRHCGAPIEPGRELCDYCKQVSAYKKYAGALKDRQCRVLIDVGYDLVYFDEITRMGGYEKAPNRIEVTTIDDVSTHYISGVGAAPKPIEVDMPLTDRSTELFSLVRDDTRYRVRIEAFGKVAYETKAYIERPFPTFEPGCIAKHTMLFHIDDDMNFIRLEKPKGICCPNCGAPITSGYGACDYCGGWIEYIA